VTERTGPDGGKDPGLDPLPANAEREPAPNAQPGATVGRPTLNWPTNMENPKLCESTQRRTEIEQSINPDQTGMNVRPWCHTSRRDLMTPAGRCATNTFLC